MAIRSLLFTSAILIPHISGHLLEQLIDGSVELAIAESLGVSNDDTHLSPQPNYTEGVLFRLFTRRFYDDGVELQANPASLLRSPIDPTVPTKIIILGFDSRPEGDPTQVLKRYLGAGEYNFILVDWSKISTFLWYPSVRFWTGGVARRVADFLDALADSGLCLPRDQHLLGHSLGAQIAGMASGAARTKPGRCTGLEPGGPLFELASSEGRIDSSVATLVDIIHTTSGSLGMAAPVGHVDFYPNGGTWPQPDCRGNLTDAVVGYCSHLIAINYFVNTILHPTVYIGRRCQTSRIIRGDCPLNTVAAVMGEHVVYDTPGGILAVLSSFTTVGEDGISRLLDMSPAIPFIPLSPIKFFPYGVMSIFLALVQGLELPTTQSASMLRLAEVAVWESVGISDADFNDSDSFVTSLGIGDPPDYEAGMRFVLFNRENRQNGTVITSDPSELRDTLNPDVKTKIFIHGFRNDLDSEGPAIIRDAYLDHDDYNLIMVDWAALAVAPNYVAARSHAVEVARRTAILLNALADSNVCAPRDQHIIGHSLGGQVAGLAAGQARTKPGRCTGLDPAGPLFQVSTTDGRIDPTDADLVDIIHTTAALWGFPGPVGDIDFYPNGGVWPQPGCHLDVDGNCSHVLSLRLFAFTISNPNAFVGFRCQTHGIVRGNCPTGTQNATMGESIQFQTPGMYYLEARLPE